MRSLRAVVILFVLASGLCGCSLFNNGTVSLYTNRKDIVAYAEAFNAAQDSHRLELHFKEFPAESIERDEISPDLIIASFIAGKTDLNKFRPLDRLINERRINGSSFYPGLLSLGRHDKQQVLLPISFDLPAVMFDTSIPGEESSAFSLNLEKIRSLAAAFNQQEKGRYTAMGFSPRWNADFLVLYAMLYGTDFVDGPDYSLQFNERNLEAAVESVREWSRESNGGPETETQYEEKYLYDPPYRQVALGRAKFAYIPAAEFFLLPENRRISLDFRWISHRDKILALDTIVWAGIPLRAKNAKGAEDFLKWLLNPETQKDLLTKVPEKTAHTFGIASGFSSIREVNEKEYPKLYPHLAGHIPPADSLIFPPGLSNLWIKLKEQVIRPYLKEQTEESRPQESLSARLKAWRLKQTD